VPTFALDGQTVLVTGAGKRLGRAAATALAQAGAGVILHYQTSREEAESLMKEIRGAGGRAWTIQANLSEPEEAAGLVARCTELAGPISGLVNSASIYPADTLHEMTEASLQSNIRVNAWAPFVLAKAVAAQGIRASIVNFLDTRILDYDAQHVSYHLSKRMLFSLTRMMALEFAPAVRVNAIAPGLVLPLAGKDEAYLESLAHTNPLNTFGSADDIARAVVFLFASPFITGEVIYVDGGRHMLGGVYG
jgi:NAD(P)-dependent dehydrogenase (short-subunit alcohol dehydrogenase family)